MPLLTPLLSALVAGVATALHIPALRSDLRRSRSVLESYRMELRNIEDVLYVGEMLVGGEKVVALYDTGSPELAIMSDKCTKGCGSESHLYHASKSATYQNGTGVQSIQYGSGGLKGVQAFDMVKVGTLDAGLTPFWETIAANFNGLDMNDFAAIVGLGPMDPGMQLMTPEGGSGYALLLRALKIDCFSVCFNAAPWTHGYITFGESSGGSHFTRLPVVDHDYWMVKLTDVAVNGTVVACDGGCGAVLDSGTSLLAAPTSAVVNIADLLVGLSCDLSLLPSLTFKLNGEAFVLPPEAFVAEFVGSMREDVARHLPPAGKQAQAAGTGSCGLAIMQENLGSSPAGPLWILGMPFFRYYYTKFKQDGEAIYVAPTDGNCNPVAAESSAAQGSRASVPRARRLNAGKLRRPTSLREKKKRAV